jgi:hypothetical protein
MRSFAHGRRLVIVITFDVTRSRAACLIIMLTLIFIISVPPLATWLFLCSHMQSIAFYHSLQTRDLGEFENLSSYGRMLVWLFDSEVRGNVGIF